MLWIDSNEKRLAKDSSMVMLDDSRLKRPNAALEWQAMSMGRHSRGLMVACPLEGLVRFYRILLMYLEKTQPRKDALASAPHHSTSVHFRPLSMTSTISPR